MSKRNKKKRNKKYTGSDAASAPARVTKVSVPKRSAPAKFWHENKSRLRRWIIFVLFIILGYAILG